MVRSVSSPEAVAQVGEGSVVETLLSPLARLMALRPSMLAVADPECAPAAYSDPIALSEVPRTDAYR